MVDVQNSKVVEPLADIQLLREGTPQPQGVANAEQESPEYKLNRDIVYTAQYDLAEVSYRDAIIRNPTKKNQM